MKAMQHKPTEAMRRHKWPTSTERARALQNELRKEWEGEDRLGKIRTVAGLDAAFLLVGSQALKKPANSRSVLREANRAIGCVIVYRFPEMEELERACAAEPLRFPYIPGLLSFREIPVLLAALNKLKVMPDLLFCDGHGYAHPRRFGLASHLGVLLNRPTIGCAKSILIGKQEKLAEQAGSWSALVDEKAGGECIGAALRTRTGVRPIYVSQGHRVSLKTAIRWTLAVGSGFRIPRPTRDADRYAGEMKRRFLRGGLCEK